MIHKVWVFALSMALAASPAAASRSVPMTSAPVAGPDARYCLRVEPALGSRIETIQCWTRAEWAELEIDVDQEWAQEGVTVLQ